MSRAYAASVERMLLGLAWADAPDGDVDDPVELSERLRLPVPTDWDAVADALVAPEGGDRLLREIARIEAAGVGPPGGILRGDRGRSLAWHHLARRIVERVGVPALRLAASTPGTPGRHRASVPVEGSSGLVEVRLEPTTDGVWMGVVTRLAGSGAVEVLVASADRSVRAVQLAATEAQAVFYVDQDPGAATRVWAHVAA